MESLNLNTLANSLPATQQNAEKELLNDFKAAALSITTLYRSSRKTSKRAYNAGYGAACQDLLNFIQQGVSASDIGLSPSGSSTAMEGGGMTIGRVMDWTEARLEAIKAREEEEDEDEEKEKDKERAAHPPRPSATTMAPVVSKADGKKSATSRPKENQVPSTSEQLSSSPSPPPSGGASTSSTRPLKLRTISPLQHTNIPSSTTDTFPIPPPHQSPSVPFPDPPIVIGAGAKRRHAMMMMLDSAASPISIGGHGHGGGPSSVTSSPGGGVGSPGAAAASGMSRRRTRSSRNLSQHQHQNQNIQMASEAMDVEEDGRERKRVARR